MIEPFHVWWSRHPDPAFGEWLERLRASVPNVSTDVDLLDYLGQHGLRVSDTALGHWKADRGFPDAHNLMALFRIFDCDEGERREISWMVTRKRAEARRQRMAADLTAKAG